MAGRTARSLRMKAPPEKYILSLWGVDGRGVKGLVFYYV